MTVVERTRRTSKTPQKYVYAPQLDRYSSILVRIASEINRPYFHSQRLILTAVYCTTVAANRRIRGGEGRWGRVLERICTGDESLETHPFHLLATFQQGRWLVSHCAFVYKTHSRRQEQVPR